MHPLTLCFCTTTTHLRPEHSTRVQRPRPTKCVRASPFVAAPCARCCPPDADGATHTGEVAAGGWWSAWPRRRPTRCWRWTSTACCVTVAVRAACRGGRCETPCAPSGSFTAPFDTHSLIVCSCHFERTHCRKRETPQSAKAVVGRVATAALRADTRTRGCGDEFLAGDGEALARGVRGCHRRAEGASVRARQLRKRRGKDVKCRVNAVSPSLPLTASQTLHYFNFDPSVSSLINGLTDSPAGGRARGG